MVGRARQQEVFFREDIPMEWRVLATFLYHAGLSYRRIEPFVDRLYEALRQWFHRLKHLFEPDCQDRQEVTVAETKIEIDGSEHYVWASADCETLKILSVETSPSRSSLGELRFLNDGLAQCRGRSLVRADRGPWYGWTGRSNS